MHDLFNRKFDLHFSLSYCNHHAFITSIFHGKPFSCHIITIAGKIMSSIKRTDIQNELLYRQIGTLCHLVRRLLMILSGCMPLYKWPYKTNTLISILQDLRNVHFNRCMFVFKFQFHRPYF